MNKGHIRRGFSRMRRETLAFWLLLALIVFIVFIIYLFSKLHSIDFESTNPGLRHGRVALKRPEGSVHMRTKQDSVFETMLRSRDRAEDILSSPRIKDVNNGPKEELIDQNIIDSTQNNEIPIPVPHPTIQSTTNVPKNVQVATKPPIVSSSVERSEKEDKPLVDKNVSNIEENRLEKLKQEHLRQQDLAAAERASRRGPREAQFPRTFQGLSLKNCNSMFQT